MTTETKEPKREINWTPIILAGAAIGGIYLIRKIVGAIRGESEANREQARLILEDWQQEFDELKPYTETIYAGGRTPTDQEIAILSSMLDQMKIKEITVNQLSKSVFSELVDVAEALAKLWWVLPAVFLSPIAGYLTYRLVKGWKDRRRPPPNFPCPKCGAVYGTEGALKHHIENDHIPTSAYAVEARQAFDQTSTWIQNAVAIESYYARTFTNWRTWSPSEIRTLSWALTSAWVYGIGAASELILLKTALMLLLV